MPESKDNTPDQFGIFCTYGGDKAVSPGSLAVVATTNGGGERWEFIVKSRGGRMIRKFLRLDRCSNWRVKFIAPRFRGKGPYSWQTRGPAEACLDSWGFDLGVHSSAVEQPAHIR